MPTADFTIGAATFATTGANSTTTGQSFAVIFDMALPPPKSPAIGVKSGMIGEICAMIGTIASVGGGKNQFRSIA